MNVVVTMMNQSWMVCCTFEADEGILNMVGTLKALLTIRGRVRRRHPRQDREQREHRGRDFVVQLHNFHLPNDRVIGFVQSLNLGAVERIRLQ